MSTTYDPILEIRELRRMRVFSPLSSPGMGTALVLEPDTGKPLIIESGEPVPEARLGRYRRSFLIDLRPYSLSMDMQLPSADPAFLFQGVVNFSCQVGDPADVARHSIRDMTAAVRPPLGKIMRRVASKYDISKFNEAEAALNDALEEFSGDSTIRLGNYLMELSVGGEDAARSSAKYHDVSRDERMEKIRRGTMSDVVAGGRDELVAQWLAKYEGDPSKILEMEADAKERESERLLSAMAILASSGEDTEAFDTRQERRRLLSRFLSDYGVVPAMERERPGSRRRRLTGSLVPGTSEEGSTKDDESADRDGKPDGDDRVSRVHRGPSGGEPAKPAKAPPDLEGHHPMVEDGPKGDARGTRPSRVRGLLENRSDRKRSQPRDPDAASGS